MYGIHNFLHLKKMDAHVLSRIFLVLSIPQQSLPFTLDVMAKKAGGREAHRHFIGIELHSQQLVL